MKSNAEIEWTCENCVQRFWGPVDLKNAEVRLCEECMAEYTDTPLPKKKRSKKQTALVPAAVPVQTQTLDLALPNEADFAQELRHWVNEAHTSYAVPKATFLQRITGHGHDASNAEHQRQWNAEQAVKGVVEREKRMLNGLKQVHIARLEAETDIIHARSELLEAHIEHMRLLEQARALQKGPAKAQQIAPPPDPEEDEEDEEVETDPEINFVMERQRKKARERAMADQAVISEFLKSVRRVFNNGKLEKNERALRIRSFMDSFGKGLEDLPANIRKFLEETESAGDDA